MHVYFLCMPCWNDETVWVQAWIGQGRDAPVRIRSSRISFVTIANMPSSIPVIRTTATAIRRDLAGVIFDAKAGLGCVESPATPTSTGCGAPRTHFASSATQQPQRPQPDSRGVHDSLASTSTSTSRHHPRLDVRIADNYDRHRPAADDIFLDIAASTTRRFGLIAVLRSTRHKQLSCFHISILQ